MPNGPCTLGTKYLDTQANTRWECVGTGYMRVEVPDMSWHSHSTPLERMDLFGCAIVIVIGISFAAALIIHKIDRVITLLNPEDE